MTNLNRRAFLSKAGIAAAVPAISPVLHGGTTTPGPPVVTGNGDWTYEVVPGWGSLPSGTSFGGTHGAVAEDNAGNILRQHTKHNRGPRLQPRWKFDQDHSECIHRSSFYGSRRGARRGVFLRDRSEGYGGRKLAVHKDEDRWNCCDENHRSSRSRI